MKKNIVLQKSLLLGVAGTLLLMGCSTDTAERDTNGETTSSNEKVSIQIFNSKVEMKDSFENLVDQYLAENSNVDIEVKTIGGGSNWEATLKTDFASGNQPDIFPIGGPAQVAEYRDSLTDLSDTAAAEAALDGTLKSVIDGDEILGLPFNQEGFGVLYNKTIFEELAIDVSNILTIEDLENVMEEIDSQKESLGIEAVTAFPAMETWIMGNHISNAYLSPEFDENIVNAFDADTISFEKGKELQQFIDLQNEYSIQPTLNLDYSQQVEEYFSLQRVAMITMGNFVYPTIHQMDSDFAQNEVGIFPIPVEGYEGMLPIDVPTYWAVNVNSDEEVIQASKDFLDWMYTSEEGKTLVLEELQFMPAYEGYDSEKIYDPISQELYEYSLEGNGYGWVYRGFPQGWSEETLGSNMQKYLSGNMDWEELEKDSIDAWENMRQ